MKKLITLLSMLPLSSLILGQSLQVVETYPLPQSLSEHPAHEITIQFNEELNTATVGPESFMVFGRWSGPMTGTLSFSNNDQTLTFSPDEDFFYGEYVTVGMTKTIESATGNLLISGYQFSYWTKTEPGYMLLPEVEIIEMRTPDEIWIQCYGAYAGDINDDGFTDLTVVNEAAEDIRILLNDSTGHFGDMSIQPIAGSTKPSTNEGADFNHDGMIDLAIGSTQGPEVCVLIGNGDGTYQNEMIYEADMGVRGLAILDMDGDGYTDIATANRVGSNMAFFLNNQAGGFELPYFIDTPPAAETATMAADFNNDGIMDLAVGAYTGSAVMVLIGDGMGGFELTAEVGVMANPWMVACGDVNGDGNCDLVSANAGGSNMSVHFGDGNGGLSDPNYYDTGGFPLAIDLGDLDGDGDLDMISSNYSGHDFTLYENDGNGQFINPITMQAVDAGSCAIFHDRNNDGVMDITGIDEIADLVILFENSAVTNLLEASEELLTLFPNPCKERFNVRGVLTNEQVHLCDLSGRMIQNWTGSRQVDVSSLTSGMYFIQVPDRGISMKLVIE